MNGVGKIGGDKIRQNLPFPSIPKILAFAVTGAHQDASRTSAAGKFDIAMTVTDDDGLMQVYGMFPCRAFEHTRFRLAAIAAISRGVRAMINSI